MLVSNKNIKRSDIFLGISDSHDAGAALIVNGEVLAAINEERLSRKKMASGFPILAIEKVFDITGINPKDVVAVGFAGKSSAGKDMPTNIDLSNNAGQYLFSQKVVEFIDRLPGGKNIFSASSAVTLYQGSMDLRVSQKIDKTRKYLKTLGVNAPVFAFDHHDAHLASAYYSAGHSDALLISNDGFGDGLCSKVAIANSKTGEITTISSNSFYNSLGVYYSYATLLCGFMKGHHAGKTTGLAAYGNPEKTLKVFQEMIEWNPTLGIYKNRGGVFRNCIATLRKELANQSREDIAAGIQKHCEDIITAMVRHYVRLTNKTNVVLVGGVHANVKLNQRIAELPEVKSLFVFPNMGDGGLPLGGAYLAMAKMSSKVIQPTILKHVYLGPSFQEEDMLNVIKQSKLHYYRPKDYAMEVAKLLSDEKVVARFDGAMEYGPRALGNRSILYSAAKQEVNGWLNKQLNRTEFMPFAPVIRDRDAPDFFERYSAKTYHTAEFMTVTYDVTERCKREAPATVHVDGTARPQVVKRDVNLRYYDILTEYNKLTGLSVLVNTSFNMHEEPIVCTPEEAVKAFLDSKIDVLALGPFIVVNTPAEVIESNPK